LNLRRALGALISGSNNNIEPKAVVQSSTSHSVSFETIPTPPNVFREIVGHDSTKNIIGMALNAERPTHVLLIGPPGCGKSEFLKQIGLNYTKKSVYVDGSYGSKAGMHEKLYANKHRVKYLLLDEIEKLKPMDQQGLLTLMESCRLSKTTKTESYDIPLKVWVFATCNQTKILGPLQDRFVPQYFKEYTRAESIDIAESRLCGKPWRLDSQLAYYLAEQVLDTLGTDQFRKCIQVANLIQKFKNKVAVDHVIKAMQGDSTQEPGIEDYGT